MMETQNNFIFAILMLISTCSQNLMDTVNELSIDNNLKNKKYIEYEVLINEEGKILFDNEMISSVKIEDAINRKLKRDDDAIFNIIIHPDARYKRIVGILESIKKTDAKIEVMVIDSLEILSKQIKEPPPRPSVPTASDDEFEDAEYDEFDESEFDDWDDWDTPPPQEKKIEEFIAYDKAPRPKYGKGIFDFLVYPKLAIDMQLEGKVFIKFFVDKHGKVKPSSIQMIRGNPVFERAIIDAVAKSQWEPAMQRDMKVGVWMTVPAKFSLKNAK